MGFLGIHYLYAEKFDTILAQKEHNKSLYFLFYKEGFSFWIADSATKTDKVSHFKVTHFNLWETEIIKELEVNLRLKRNFDEVKVAFISSFFSLVPKDYAAENPEVLLNFSEAEFEDNQLIHSVSEAEFSFVYGTSSVLIKKLKEQYGKVQFFHSGEVFLKSIENGLPTTVHLNLNQHQLEIAVTSESKVLFYNLFETPTGEDILFFTLFVMEQLELDTNKVVVKTYGELMPETKVFQILRKYVRHVSAASKDEAFLRHFTIYSISKCASFQVNSEGKK